MDNKKTCILTIKNQCRYERDLTEENIQKLIEYFKNI